MEGLVQEGLPLEDLELEDVEPEQGSGGDVRGFVSPGQSGVSSKGKYSSTH